MTRTVIALDPTSSAIAALALPLVTAAGVVPCLPTPTVAFDSVTVGVSFTCVIEFATVAV